MSEPREQGYTSPLQEDRTSDRPRRERQQADPDQRRVVVFVDMLGFAALTEKWALEPRRLVEGSRSFSFGVPDEVLTSANELTNAFVSFHNSIEVAITFARMARPLTAVTFSDSVFIATAYPSDATGLAVELVRKALSRALPLRIGIALGSFAAIRFRSDITTDGGDHAALFLGTAVVRAYQAEKCGIKGIRILLHPSVEPLFVRSASNPHSATVTGDWHSVLRCTEDECSNPAGVQYELDYWDLAPTAERNAWHAIQDMWASAPACAREHYESTARAVDRMRVAKGQPPLHNLRRRTLPRRRE